jgi:hypothetical protein
LCTGRGNPIRHFSSCRDIHVIAVDYQFSGTPPWNNAGQFVDFVIILAIVSSASYFGFSASRIYMMRQHRRIAHRPKKISPPAEIS